MCLLSKVFLEPSLLLLFLIPINKGWKQRMTKLASICKKREANWSLCLLNILRRVSVVTEKQPHAELASYWSKDSLKIFQLFWEMSRLQNWGRTIAAQTGWMCSLCKLTPAPKSRQQLSKEPNDQQKHKCRFFYINFETRPSMIA